MGLKDRFTRAKPQDNEMVKRPESSNSGDSVSKTFTPRQLIPEGELDGLFIDKNSNRVDRGPPRQQIPENEIKHLLSGKIKAETKTKIEAPKTEVVKDQKPKEKKQPPIVKLLSWIKQKGIAGKKIETGVVVESERWELPKAEPIKSKVEQKPTERNEPMGEKVPQVEATDVGTKSFIPDPPLQKGRKNKSVVETIKEKKKESIPKLVKKLTYEEAIEAYEREMAGIGGKQKQAQAKNKDLDKNKDHQIKVEKARPDPLSKKEYRTLKVMSKLPGFIKSLRARKNGVAFKVMCGIYQYEYVGIVKNKSDGVRFMKGIREMLNYESIMEVYHKRHSEVIVIYARAKMEHRGRYSGTPLHPRLEEKF